MSTILIHSATLVNEGTLSIADVLIRNGIIEKIASQIDVKADQEINAEGLHHSPLPYKMSN